MQLLLLSNSTSDNGFLVDWIPLIREFVAGELDARFLPYAGVIGSWDDYEARVAEALSPAGLRVRSVHRAADPVAAIAEARVLMVGGGNTFNLLHHCRKQGLLTAIVRSVQGGMRYIGWSAGSNLACPTIRTTNDMPVVDPGGFDALGLVPFQINPHFTDAKPAGHHGETRTQRLAEFTAANPSMPVLGLPEGCYVRVDDEAMRYGGARDAVWLRHGAEAQPVAAGALRLPA
jgi:dipeptidase E